MTSPPNQTTDKLPPSSDQDHGFDCFVWDATDGFQLMNMGQASTSRKTSSSDAVSSDPATAPSSPTVPAPPPPTPEDDYSIDCSTIAEYGDTDDSDDELYDAPTLKRKLMLSLMNAFKKSTTTFDNTATPTDEQVSDLVDRMIPVVSFIAQSITSADEAGAKIQAHIDEADVRVHIFQQENKELKHRNAELEVRVAELELKITQMEKEKEDKDEEEEKEKKEKGKPSKRIEELMNRMQLQIAKNSAAVKTCRSFQNYVSGVNEIQKENKVPGNDGGVS